MLNLGNLRDPVLGLFVVEENPAAAQVSHLGEWANGRMGEWANGRMLLVERFDIGIITLPKNQA